MHMFIRDLLVKEPVIQSLNELIKGNVRELEAAQEVLAFLDAGHLDRGIDWDVCDGEVGVKDLVEFLFAERDPEEVTGPVPVSVWGDKNRAHVAVFCGHDLDLHILVLVLLNCLYEAFFAGFSLLLLGIGWLGLD